MMAKMKLNYTLYNTLNNSRHASPATTDVVVTIVGMIFPATALLYRTNNLLCLTDWYN